MTHKRIKPWIFIFWVFIGLTFPHTKAKGDSDPKSRAKPVEIERVTKVNGKLGLNSTIEVEAENLSEYLKQPKKDAKEFVLYLNGRPIRGLNSRLIDKDKLSFDIERTSESKDAWNHLLGKPKGPTRKVDVSIGYKDENPVLEQYEHPLVIISIPGFWTFAVIFIIVLILFVRWAKNDSIIRDSCVKLNDPKEKTFSLGRTQMAFWFFIVVVSYVFIWMITGDLDTLTESALILIGISTATALGSTAIGSNKFNTAKIKYHELEVKKAKIGAKLNELEEKITKKPAPTNISDLISEKEEKKVQCKQVTEEMKSLNKAMTPKKSKGFFRDILNDANGMSLHRFQIAIWTLVLGCIFLKSIYNNLAMPEFSATLLGLMGISSGTYIGFKFPEKQA